MKDTDDVTSTQILMVCQIKCRVLIEIKSNLPVSSGSILQLLFKFVPSNQMGFADENKKRPKTKLPFFTKCGTNLMTGARCTQLQWKL